MYLALPIWCHNNICIFVKKTEIRKQQKERINLEGVQKALSWYIYFLIHIYIYYLSFMKWGGGDWVYMFQFTDFV